MKTSQVLIRSTVFYGFMGYENAEECLVFMFHCQSRSDLVLTSTLKSFLFIYLFILPLMVKHRVHYRQQTLSILKCDIFTCNTSVNI